MEAVAHPEETRGEGDCSHKPGGLEEDMALLLLRLDFWSSCLVESKPLALRYLAGSALASRLQKTMH